jgi:hypothetical protein
MSRPSLLHPLGERHSRRRRRPHATRVSATVAESSSQASQTCDPAVMRVREAGGPLDHASYGCPCGYVFDASVSTSVTCPHCGAGQAW